MRVMTIHGAKGLDFEHIYVVQLHKGSGRATARGVSRRGGRRARVPPVRRADPGLGPRGAAARPRRGGRARAHALRRDDARQEAPGARGHLARAPALGAAGPDHASSCRSGAKAGPISTRPRPSWPRAASTSRTPPARAGSFRACRRRRPPALCAAAGARQRFRRRARWRARRRRCTPRASAHGRTRRAPSAAPPPPPPSGDARRARGTRLRRGRARRRGAAGAAREVARAVGTAVHRVLEEFDFAADPQAELARQRAALETLLAGSADADARGGPRASRADRARGALRAAVRARRHVLPRELPVLLPPEAGAGPAASSPASSTSSIAIRRRPSGSSPTTRRTASRATPRRGARPTPSRARLPAGPARRARARHTPRFELWFLDADRVEVVA